VPAQDGGTPAPELAQAHEQPDAGEDIDGGGMVDVREEDKRELAMSGARTIPKEPDPKWARPPCPGGYATINGACWLMAANVPPCPVGTYEHAGRCYAPLQRGARVPSSVDP
jgi:hypothetical protein